jgi:hypothetical protein
MEFMKIISEKLTILLLPTSRRYHHLLTIKYIKHGIE